MKKLIYFSLLALVFTACTQEFQQTEISGENDQIGIQLSSVAFKTPASSGGTTVEKLDGYLFINGILTYIYPNLSIDTKELELPIYFQGIKASLYMVANTNEVNSPLNEPSTLVIGSTKESDFPLHFEGKEQITLTAPPLARRTDLSNLNPAEPIEIKLRHAHARLDMKIEEENVEITDIELKNIPKNGYLINEQEQPSEQTKQLFDYTENYKTPITSSQTIGYINEGNNLNIPVTVRGRFNGVEVNMSLTLPQQMKRNAVYTIRISKVGVTLNATVKIDDWEDGGESDATPDVNAKILFNPGTSVLPEGSRYSKTMDTLYVPSNQATNLILALRAGYEVDAEISGHSSGITLTPGSDFNRFQMTVNGQQSGSPAYYSYIKIKNKFFESYYADRLVVTVAPNYDAPIADVAQLATVAGIQVTNNLASVVPYGSSITIPAARLKVNGRTLETVQGMQILSAPTGSYRAIKLIRNGNNLALTSVQNTTGEAQTVTAIVNGIASDGGVFAVIVSFTIPAVPANELTALNALFVQMGGNTWMQFNTTGTYAGDIQNAVAISQLGEITFNKIKNNFSRFGFYKNGGTYNTTNTCPPGFRTPSSQEFLNLLGVSNAAGLSIFGSVSSAPVNTPGGMTVTHTLFKQSSGSTGEAVVSIQKDATKVYLTNGRFVATSGRTFFEFWHPGSFSIGQAASNSYNWTRRCVKITTYNGLE